MQVSKEKCNSLILGANFLILLLLKCALVANRYRRICGLPIMYMARG